MSSANILDVAYCRINDHYCDVILDCVSSCMFFDASIYIPIHIRISICIYIYIHMTSATQNQILAA